MSSVDPNAPRQPEKNAAQDEALLVASLLKMVVLPKLQELKSRLENGLDFVIDVSSKLAFEPDSLDNLPVRADFVLAKPPENFNAEKDRSKVVEAADSWVVFSASPDPGHLSISMSVGGKKFNGEKFNREVVDADLVEAHIFRLVNVCSGTSAPSASA